MADLLPTAEQQELASSVARLLASEGADPLLELGNMGWLGIGTPEQAGGTDLPLEARALVARELGRAVAPLQALGAIIGAQIAALDGQKALTDDILCEAVRIAFAVPSGPEGYYLVDYKRTNFALLVTPEAASIHFVRDSSTAVAFDDSLNLSHTGANNLQSVCCLISPQPHREMLVLAAAYATGLSEAITAMASDYARTREQFGQPIGAFQAIKHRCADMAIRADAAWSQTVFAALSPESDYQALSAFIVAASYAIESAQENIQLHGAIGITEELIAHRYLKRAHVIDMAFGPISRCRDVLLARDDLQAMTA